jgi:hypothetical protein
VLQLVIRKLIELREVTLCDELEVRGAVGVERQPLVLDLPADLLAVLLGSERVTESRRIRPEPPEPAELLAAVRMT